MSKYNDFMSHIRVDDDMHRRIMDAVSKAIKEEASASSAHVEPLRPDPSVNSEIKTPIKRRAKVSVIKILSIAAASVIVVGGSLLLAARFFARSGSTKSVMGFRNEAASTTAANEVDQAVNGIQSFTGGNKDNPAAASGANEDENEETVEKSPDSIEAEVPNSEKKKVDMSRNTYGIAAWNAGRSDYINALPFKIRNSKIEKLDEGKISVLIYEGEKGEKMCLLEAAEGTDIVKAYYPGFKGVPTLITSKDGVKFLAIDVSAGEGEQAALSGPFDAVTWTKDGHAYMLAISPKAEKDVFITLVGKILTK